MRLAVVLLALFMAAPAAADVVDTAANGFTIKVVLQVAATPETVYTSLVRHVGDWWDAEHTYSGDSKNLSIRAEAGGCFCEVLPAAKGVAPSSTRWS